MNEEMVREDEQGMQGGAPGLISRTEKKARKGFLCENRRGRKICLETGVKSEYSMCRKQLRQTVHQARTVPYKIGVRIKKNAI